MPTYISILRGINVSGHKMIKMDALRKMYSDLGFKNVQTYIQSGNVVFQDKIIDSKKLEKKIAKKILEQFSFEVPIIVIELGELKTIVKNNPFGNDTSKDISYMHVTFLSAIPDKPNVDKIKEGKYGADEFILISNAIYLYCPNGYGISKLNNNFIESKLKVMATTRNWRTTNELLNMAESLQKK